MNTDVVAARPRATGPNPSPDAPKTMCRYRYVYQDWSYQSFNKTGHLRQIIAGLRQFCGPAPKNGPAAAGLGQRDGLGGGGGNTIQITYNVDARNTKLGVEREIIRALKQLDRSVERRAVNAVLDARQRGGAFARSFGGV